MISIITLLTIKAFCSQTLFDQGIQSYNNKNYRQAEAYFEELLEKNQNDANVLYNLGIIKYKIKEVGTAVGFLNAALLRRHRLAKPALEKIKKTHSEIEVYEYNLKDKIFNLPFSLFLFSKFLFLTIFYSRFIVLYNKKSGFYFRKFIFSWIFLLILSGIVFIKFSMDNQLLAISKQHTSLYAAPDETSAPILTIPIGRRVIIKKLNNNWALVKDQNNIGWILENNLFYISYTKI